MTSVAIKISQDLGVLDILAEHQDGKSTAELAKATGSDLEFIRRILRLLVSTRFIEETEIGNYKATELSRSFTHPGFVGGMNHLFTQGLPVFTGLPRFMANTSYVTPETPTDGPFQFGLKTPDSFFQWLVNHPKEGEGFNALMSVVHEQTSYSWIKVYPISDLTKDGTPEAGVPLVVDVGGGVGRDMENLRQALLPGVYPLLVQDLDSVIQQGKRQAHQSIDLQVHDFFQDQPVRGARAYFMHSILHDWPDADARRILHCLKQAMTPGYSKLLLCENVLPEGARLPPIQAAIDLVMMGLLTSKERTEAEWRELLATAGYNVVKIWGKDEVAQCIIEAEPLLSAKV